MKIRKRARRDARKLFQDCMVNGSLDDNRVRQVVNGVIALEKRDCPAILAQFLRLLKLEIARTSATIQSATPLPQDLQRTIQTGLSRRYGPRLSTAFAHSPDLIGGIRIQVGSDVYDGSVRAELEALERSF